MKDCIFCRIAKHEEEAWIVHETESSCAFLDARPMGAYHTLVIPKIHFEEIFDIPLKDLQELVGALKHVVDLYREKLGIKDVQILSNNGAAAQQKVFHFHFHIAPRSAGDGQDLHWKTNPRLTKEYDALLERLGVGKKTDGPGA